MIVAMIGLGTMVVSTGVLGALMVWGNLKPGQRLACAGLIGTVYLALLIG